MQELVFCGWQAATQTGELVALQYQSILIGTASD
jgi:hypothetical protein